MSSYSWDDSVKDTSVMIRDSRDSFRFEPSLLPFDYTAMFKHEQPYKTEIMHEYIPKKVIFNGPATICLFRDGTKEVVKKMPDEANDPEKAVLYCIMKHITKAQYSYFKKEINKLVVEDK